MSNNSSDSLLKIIDKNLFWFGIINLIVGLKLTLSFFWPGLRTPGELLLSGALLLIYAAKIWSLRIKINATSETE